MKTNFYTYLSLDLNLRSFRGIFYSVNEIVGSVIGFMNFFHCVEFFITRKQGFRFHGWGGSHILFWVLYEELTTASVSSGQRYWLQIHRSRFDSRRCQTFWELLALERDPLSLVSTIEVLLERKGSCSGLEMRQYGRREPSHLLFAKVGTNFADKRQ
jgi:hypothetical protein